MNKKELKEFHDYVDKHIDAWIKNAHDQLLDNVKLMFGLNRRNDNKPLSKLVMRTTYNRLIDVNFFQFLEKAKSDMSTRYITYKLVNTECELNEQKQTITINFYMERIGDENE